MEWRILGRQISITKAASQLSPVRSWWTGWPIVREPYTGAWQRNDEIAAASVLAFSAVYSCVTLIANDIGKLPLRLVREESADVWVPVDNPAYSPVLRRPNRYQLPPAFKKQWMISKLTHGNTYVLKVRDNRQVVREMHVLDPTKVVPLVAPDGAVYYQLKADPLAGIDPAADPKWLAAPASEIIHDVMTPLYHPLVGVTPIYASGAAAMQGLAIGATSTKFFANGSKPGGILIAPGAITEAQAKKLKADWDANFGGDNAGKVAVLPHNLKYEQMHVNAHDAQLIEQLKYSVETVCSCYHVPAALIDSSHTVPYSNWDPLVQQYYAQCLQDLIVSLETCLDDGLGVREKVNGVQYGTEVDIDDLVWMDGASRAKTATESRGTLSPNEARKKYFGLGPTAGGESVMVQQQNYSLEALAKRDASEDPFRTAPPPAPEPDDPEADLDADQAVERAAARFGAALLSELYAA